MTPIQYVLLYLVFAAFVFGASISYAGKSHGVDNTDPGLLTMIVIFAVIWPLFIPASIAFSITEKCTRKRND